MSLQDDLCTVALALAAEERATGAGLSQSGCSDCCCWLRSVRRVRLLTVEGCDKNIHKLFKKLKWNYFDRHQLLYFTADTVTAISDQEHYAPFMSANYLNSGQDINRYLPINLRQV